jgi:hypothetical protein
MVKQAGRLDLLLEAAEEGGREIVALNVLGELAAHLLESPATEWPPLCETEPSRKIQLEGAAHHRPDGWDKVASRLARSQFIRRIRYDARAGTHASLRPVTDTKSDLYLVITGQGPPLALRVGTTAENAEQRRLVLDHLRRSVGF